MKGVLNSVDMQMLRKGDNVPNPWSLSGKITMILTALRVLTCDFLTPTSAHLYCLLSLAFSC